MAEYNIGDKFIVEIINKTDEPLSPYISGTTKNVTVYRLKGIPFMLDADTLSNFEKYEERKKGEWVPVTERLPEEFQSLWAACKSLIDSRPNWTIETVYDSHLTCPWGHVPMLEYGKAVVYAWMDRPLPEPPKEENRRRKYELHNLQA